MFFGGESPRLTFFLIMVERFEHGVMKIGIFLYKLRREAVGIAQHVLIHQHLRVTVFPGPDTDGQGRHLLRDFPRQGLGHTLQCDGESPGRFQRTGIVQQLLDDARALEAAGAFAVTLECVPEALARKITEQVSTLTIGIGAGKYCDAQVLVYQDMLGYADGFTPKFVKKYANLHDAMLEAFHHYKEECESGAFPAKEHTFSIDEDVLEKLY